MPRSHWLAAALVFGMAATGAAAPPPDGRALLDQVVKTYQSLDRYRFSGTLSLHVVTNGTQQAFDIPMDVAHQRPGRDRIEMRHPMMGLLMVTDGAQVTTWMAQTNHYTQRAAPAPTPDSLPAPAPAGSPIARWYNLQSGLRSAQVLRDEKVDVDGAPVDTWVVETHPDPGITGDTSARVVSVLWVDKARSVVLRDSTYVHSDHTAQGGTLDMRQTIALAHASVNDPLPDSLFSFQPPAGAQKAEAPAPPPDLTGQKAVNFTLKDMLGRARTLSAYRGKVVLLDFWATWCGPCRIELPRVEKLAREFKAKGLVTFLVNVGERADRVKPFLTKNGYTQTVLLDPDMAVANHYRADAIPTLVVIGKDGTIVAYFTGVREEDDLRDALKKAGL
jgi:thiol-disulfide isomerase/thioredoxin